MALAFDLPQEREARVPPEARGLARDAVQMLVSDQEQGTHETVRFNRLAEFLKRGDLIVVNDSATLPAALDMTSEDGGHIALHLAECIAGDLWIAEPRDARVAADQRFCLPGGGRITMVRPAHPGRARLWYARIQLPCEAHAYLERFGRPISYGYVDGRWPIAMYQTIFARRAGSVEMPSAGRPFSLRTLRALQSRGVGIATITLHCGVASPETDEPPLDERFEVSAATAHAVNDAHEQNRRVIAIGTTAVRALESAAIGGQTVHAARGWTTHIIDRDHPPRVADALLTGLHEPKASHLKMLAAFVPPDFLADAYTAALRRRLLWHEFGDVHLLLPTPRSKEPVQR